MSDFASPKVLNLVNQYIACVDEKNKKMLKQNIAAECIPEVKKLARSLARRNTDPIEDLIQVGCIGLLKAIDNYSKNHNTTFKTYATYCITGEIKHYLRDKVAMVKAPRKIHELAFRINQVFEQLLQELDRTPSTDEIAERLALPVDDVKKVVQEERRKTHISLDNNLTFFSSENLSSDFVVNDACQDSLAAKEEKVALLVAIDTLPLQYRDVIKMSFFHNMNQKEIADELEVSQMQVSRMTKKAIDMLAEILTEQWGN